MAVFPAPHAEPAEAPIATIGDDVALLAGLTAGAALIHLLLASGHVALLLCGVLQAVAAITAMRGGGRRWLAAGLTVNALAVLSWSAGAIVEQDVIGPPAIVGAVDEVLAVVLAWAALTTPLAQRHRAVWLTVVALAIPAVLTSLMLLSMGDMPHHHQGFAPSHIRSALCHLV
jgi:hypothetical protein